MKSFLFSLLTLFFFLSCGTQKLSQSQDPENRNPKTLRTQEEKETASKPLMKDRSDEDSRSGIPSKTVKDDTALFENAVKSRESKKETSISTPEKTSAPEKIKKSAPSESGLKAGFADDNKQFSYFIRFLTQYGSQVSSIALPISERIIFKVLDEETKSLPGAEVRIYDGKKELERGKTLSDGSYLFFPSQYAEISKFRALITFNQKKQELNFDKTSERTQKVIFKLKRPDYRNIPLDVVFVFDTTGSMGEEIARLKRTIEIIHLNLASLSSKPKIRFGMVLYRDREEDYVTRVVPLTEDLDEFQNALAEVEADGGGDEAEDLQSALQDTLKKINWNPSGIRMAFIITDAPPHLDYGQKYDYTQAAKDAKTQGIKIFSVGTGGLPLTAEYVLRQISQYTSGKYIFLTYGEKGESDGGKPGSVSHHTGDNFQTDKLETIIIRFAKEELSHLTNQPLDQEEEYFQAVTVNDEQKEETLKKLFEMAVAQLIDYSSLKIEEKTPTSLLPLTVSDKKLEAQAEYFSEQLFVSLAQNTLFKMVERKDFQKILGELELQGSALFDESKIAKLGNFLGAKILILGKVYEKNKNYEIFLKAVRVETGEILSVTKVRLDRQLGLSDR